MIGEGASGPTFALPAVVDGEVTTVDLADHVGRDIVLLAFYPGDFNPGCGMDRSDLDEFDLLAMQTDLSVFGISGDSVFSHIAFTDAFNLDLTLLSDTDGDAATAYGAVATESAVGYQTKRAVVLLDLDGTVAYTWSSSDPTVLPDIEAIRDAIRSIGGSDAAIARYRIGHDRYHEGERSFDAAMDGLEAEDWLVAQGEFEKAGTAFDEAASHFDSAARFADEERAVTYCRLVEAKVRSMGAAVAWLAGAASAYATDEEQRGASLRSDAEGVLQTANAIADPVAPRTLDQGTEFPSIETAVVDPEKRRQLQEYVRATEQTAEPRSAARDGDALFEGDTSVQGPNSLGAADLEEITAEIAAQSRNTEDENSGEGSHSNSGERADGEDESATDSELEEG